MFTLLPVVVKAIFAAKSAYLREEEVSSGDITCQQTDLYDDC